MSKSFVDTPSFLQLSDEQRHLIAEKERLRVLKRKLQEDLPHLYSFKHYPWSRDFFDSRNRVTLLTAANQIGKAVWDYTPILTPGGFKMMGALEVGDEVFGRDGKPTKIIAIPFKGTDNCYAFIFGDKTSLITSTNHQWICKTSRERFRKKYTSRGTNGQFDNPTYGEWVTRSTADIIDLGGLTPSNYNRVSIPIGQPIEFDERPLFDPYLVGLVLGDGCVSDGNIVITTADDEVVEYLTTNYDVTPRGKLGYYLKGLQPIFKELGLLGHVSNTKFIPSEYFFGSIEQRLSLLRGLFDTDGTITEKSDVNLSTASSVLALGIGRLVTSLGGKYQIKKRPGRYKKDGKYIECKDSYRITIKIELNPFKLTRKSERFYQTRYKHERVLYNIKDMGELPCTCITVDNADGSFLAGQDLIVTHNSSVQIRKYIHWATAVDLWPSLWPQRPRQFWYLYPSHDLAEQEFYTKWVPEFMPRGDMKNDPRYGWRAVNKAGKLSHIEFNSGVFAYFKTYGQNAQTLQAGSVSYVACDEELLVDIYDELMFRLVATSGYFSMVFTATIGQDFWRRALERIGSSDEVLPDAKKIQVSMYDCLKYEDGTGTPWNTQRIELIKRNCKSPQEIMRRVYGRFVKDSGLKYATFNRTINVIPEKKIPSGWIYFSGVDLGSGGTNHKPAIVFVAVSPDYKKGIVFKGWRGGKETYTSNDVLNVYRTMKGQLKFTGEYYDWGNKDFQTYAERVGENFQKAEKSHEVGESILNVLFKNRVLDIFDTPELQPLFLELEVLDEKTSKKHAKDDFIDALRYAVAKVPWDLKDFLVDLTPKVVVQEKSHLQLRREMVFGTEFTENEMQRVEDMIEEYNELYEY